MDLDSDFTLTIGGRAANTATSIDVVNPATGLAFASAPNGGAAELDAAVAAAAAAFPAWKGLGIEQRREKLYALADAIEAHASGFGALFLREQGRPAALSEVAVDRLHVLRPRRSCSVCTDPTKSLRVTTDCSVRR